MASHEPEGAHVFARCTGDDHFVFYDFKDFTVFRDLLKGRDIFKALFFKLGADVHDAEPLRFASRHEVLVVF